METQTNTSEQIGKISKKDLASLLQNHRSEVLKNSQERLEETEKRIDAFWHDLEYDAYQIADTCLVSQLKVSGYSMSTEQNIFLHGKKIETAVYLKNENKQFEFFEYARGETPEKAYDSLIDRLQK